MNRHEFMQRAVAPARAGMRAGEGGPFGTVVVRDGRIVGEGWNRVLTDGAPTAHGEIMAIRDAARNRKNYSLAGCELHTTGEPCPMCLGAIYWARIERVYYGFSVAEAASMGFDDAVFYREFGLPPAQRKMPCISLASDEARALTAAFARLPERIRY